MALAETLESLKRRELAQRLDQGEADVLAKVAADLPQPPELDTPTREDLQPFLAWTTQASVRYAPAKPFVVAAYVDHLAATGISTATILRRVNAISALHDRYNLADPVRTTVVRTVLRDVVAGEPPRSWNKEEQKSFVQLPPEIQAAVARRERQREIELRRMQNELADLRKRLPADAETKSAETSEKVNQNA